MLLVLAFFSLQILVAQDAPTIYGLVVNANTEVPLPGATLILLPTNESTVTNEQGQFAFENIIAGRYSLKVDFLGFQSQQQVEILVESGRSNELTIRLTPTALDLPTAVVRAGLEDVQSQFLPGTRVLTIEETRRLPATFNDPARQLIAYPGVANTNDQANNISVRGNSPGALAWRLQGVEIVNPNHLSNAGTRTDAITESGGGVNILSAQMLNTSVFYAGAIPAQYGNTQGGLMDMKLRDGNREKWEGTIQLGLLGLDASFEGPFTKNKKASYLFNYRYSTIGLLDALGVQLGDESIKFQDGALHLNFPSEKLGRFSIFGIVGNSSNIFEAERDTSIWEIRRDRTDVSYKSRMWVTGMTHQKRIGKKGIWNTSAAFSEAWNQRIAWLVDDTFMKNEISNIQTINNKLSVNSRLSFQINEKMNLNGGLEYLRSYYLIPGLKPVHSEPGMEYPLALNLWRPYADFNFRPFSKLSMNLGLSYVMRINEQVDEKELSPRININYFISAQHNLMLSYHRSIRQQPSFLFLTQNLEGFNDDLLSINGNNFSISYGLQVEDNSRLRAEIYFQHLDNAVTISDPNNQYSSLNVEELVFPPFGQLTNDGQGRNYGIEVLWQKYIQEDFYYIINGSLFNSQYKNYDQDWSATRYNSNYITNATVGKEYRWEKSKAAKAKGKTLGINIRLTYLGNLRYIPIDLEASKIAGKEILDIENTYGQQLDPYLKGDLRIYLRTDKKKYSNSLSLDIQNFLNRKNPGYFFYDPDSETIQEKRQLGLIPILSWRLSL